VNFLENRYLFKKEEFVNASPYPYERKEKDTKLIAWYLPQYYRMEVNDKYHGLGFTEWTNSSQAVPLYTGHDQPHIPYDVGYYDLSVLDSMKRQIELANYFGIYGFCFHWYWFSGARTMEKPVEMFLANKDLNIHFCLNWATENWTASWDGGNQDIIFRQDLQDGDMERLFQDFLPYFQDERYIRIHNCPLLIVYSLSMFGEKKSKELFRRLRELAVQAGFEGLYILITNHDTIYEEELSYGADGWVEFPPGGMPEIMEPYKPEGYINPYFHGTIYDYAEYVKNKKYLRKKKTPPVFNSVLTSFDNSPRWAMHANILHGSNADLYKVWLRDILKESKRKHSRDNDYVFINSWNEWAESSYLEPDVRKGYAYLEATRDAEVIGIDKV
jgi:hypothetical protein